MKSQSQKKINLFVNNQTPLSTLTKETLQTLFRKCSKAYID